MSKENIQQYSHKLLLEFKYNLDTFEKVWNSFNNIFSLKTKKYPINLIFNYFILPVLSF